MGSRALAVARVASSSDSTTEERCGRERDRGKADVCRPCLGGERQTVGADAKSSSNHKEVLTSKHIDLAATHKKEETTTVCVKMTWHRSIVFISVLYIYVRLTFDFPYFPVTLLNWKLRRSTVRSH